MGKFDELSRLAARLAGDAPSARYIPRDSPPFMSMPAERLSNLRDNPVAMDILQGSGARPEDWKKVTQFLADNQIALGDVLGSGQERVVFAAGRRGEPASSVFKIGGGRHTYELPDIPGVAAYKLRGNEGNLNFGLQDRALATYADGLTPRKISASGPREYWQDRALDVDRSLRNRAWNWLDPDESNIGIFRDGTFSVIDGPVVPYHDRPPSDLLPEEAIRLLRNTQEW